MIRVMHLRFRSHRIPVGTLLIVFALVIGANEIAADEVPAFFLKIAKNMPRVGRSNTFPDFFLKEVKSIPKIGRRNVNPSSSEEMTSDNNSGHFNELFKRMINYNSPENPETVSWGHFPLAIEGPPELWRSLAAYTNDKYGTPSDNVNNEIWQRDKRMDNVANKL